MRLAFSLTFVLLLGGCHSDNQNNKDNMGKNEDKEVSDTSFRVTFESDSTKRKLIKDLDPKISASKTERKVVIDSGKKKDE